MMGWRGQLQTVNDMVALYGRAAMGQADGMHNHFECVHIATEVACNYR